MSCFLYEIIDNDSTFCPFKLNFLINIPCAILPNNVFFQIIAYL